MSKKHRKLTDAESAELFKNAQGVLNNVRKQMLNVYPFVGSIALTLNVVPVRDFRVKTAAVCGSYVYFNIDFLARLSAEERVFVFAHETYHNVLRHSLRCGMRDKKIFNLAADIEINQLLVKDGLSMPKDCLLPSTYGFAENLSAEEYYDLLVDTGNADSMADKAKSASIGKNGEGNLAGQFDGHMTPNEKIQGNDEAPEGLSDKYGDYDVDPNFMPDTSEAEMRNAADTARNAAIQASQQIMRERGELAGHVKQLISKLSAPKISWKEQLSMFITRSIGSKTTWNSPNKRYASRGLYLPSRDGEKIKLAVGIDTSGSTALDVKQFMSEVGGIVDAFGEYELHLLQCDTRVTDYKFYSTEEDVLFDPNVGIRIRGGGGTSLHPIFNYVKDNCLDVDAIVIFTDGECEEFNADEEADCPTMWVLTNDAKAENIRFGEKIRFKHDSKYGK